MYANPRSIVNKLKQFQSLVCSKTPDIIGLTETWLNENIFDNEILPSNYTLFRKDRPSRGGGVLIAVNNIFPCQLITSPENLETICIKLMLPNPITLCVNYVPPSSTAVYYDNLFNFFLHLHEVSVRMIILGDFNLPDIDWDMLSGHSQVSNQFCDLVFQTGLSQLIDKPTHIHGNILDLLLTNLEDSVCHLQIHSDRLLPSDHYSITFSVSVSVVASSKSTTYSTFNYSKGDYRGLCEYLLCCDFTPCYLSHDVEYIWHTIEHLLMDAMHSFIPTNKVHSHQHPIWFNSEIRHSINRLRTLRRRHKRHPTQYTSNTIDSLEKALQEKIAVAKLTFESELINTYAPTNNNKIFKYLKSITKSNNIPSVMNLESLTANTDHSIASLFNQYFHSVIMIHPLSQT